MPNNSTEADGGLAGVVDPTDFFGQPGSFDAVNEELAISNLLLETKFNAPLPYLVRNGWNTGGDKYSSAASFDANIIGPELGVPYKSVAAIRDFNAPGFIVADPKITLEVEKVTEGQSSWISTETKYGFRFHFNPEVFAERYARRMDVNWLQYMQTLSKLDTPPTMAHTGATMTINLLLSRRDDVRLCQRDDYANFYSAITAEDAELIRTQGTMYDIEYLMRVINGAPMDTWHGLSADYGMLMNRVVLISVGNSPGARKIRGIINNMGWTHQQFAPGMIPVYTELTLNISRIPDMYDQSAPDATAANNAEIFASGLSEADGGDSSSSGFESGAPVTTGDAGRVVAYARTLLGTFDYVNVRPSNPQTGMDCSAFVWWCYQQVYPGSMGSEPGYTGTQVGLGKPVNRENIKTGDLVFYGNPVLTLPGAHVAMYQGNGTVIHSSGTDTKQATEAGLDAAGGGMPITAIRRILEDE